MTVCDVRMAFLLRWFRSGEIAGIPKTLADKYPRLLGVMKAVFNEPRVKLYMEKIKQPTFA